MKYKLILSILALCIIASAILSFIPIEQACGTETNSCTVVQTSQYEKTLGFKNAHLGFVAFSILFLITFLYDKRPTKSKKQLIFTGLILGSIISLYFIGLQLFIIKSICKYCMIADIGILLSLIIFIFIKDKNN